MGVYSGRQVQVAAAVERVAGTSSAPTHNLILDQKSFKRMVEKQINRNSIGLRAGSFSQHIFREHSGGMLSGFADADSLGLFLVAMFGRVPVSSGNRPSRAHTWSKAEEDNVLVTPLTLYRKTDNYQEVFNKCRASKVSLKMMENSYAEYEADFMGLKGNADTTNMPTPPGQASLSFFTPKNIEVKIADSEATIAAAPNIRAKSCIINYNAKLSGYPGLGDVDYVEIGSLEYDMDIELTLLVDTDTLRQLWLSDEDRAFQVKMTGDRELVNSGATATPTFVLNVPAAKINAWGDTEPNGDFAEQTVTLRGFYHMTTGSTFKGILTNNTEDYR